MSYNPEDLKVYRPSTVDNTVDNGGIPSLDTIDSGVMNSIFEDVTSAERVSGSTRYRKLIFKPAVLNAETLYDCALLCTSMTTTAVDFTYVYGKEGDTQADIDGASGVQWRTITAVTRTEEGSDSFWIPRDVTLVASEDMRVYNTETKEFYNFDVLSISNDDRYMMKRVQVNDTEGNLPNVKVGFPTTPQLKYVGGNYGDGSDLTPRAHSASVTSTGGTVDLSKVLVFPKAALRPESIHLLFTSTDTYNVVVDGVVVKSGNINSSLTLYHPLAASEIPDTAMYEFPTTVFGGTWAANDRVDFGIESGAVAVWVRRRVNAGTSDALGVIDLGTSLFFTTT